MAASMKPQMTTADVFVCWTIYDHPADHPSHWVLRRWEDEKPDDDCQLFNTLEAARAALPPGLVCLSGDSNPVIHETWI